MKIARLAMVEHGNDLAWGRSVPTARLHGFPREGRVSVDWMSRVDIWHTQRPRRGDSENVCVAVPLSIIGARHWVRCRVAPVAQALSLQTEHFWPDFRHSQFPSGSNEDARACKSSI